MRIPYQNPVLILLLGLSLQLMIPFIAIADPPDIFNLPEFAERSLEEAEMLPEQRALVNVARKTEGDLREDRPIQACYDLLSDGYASHEVQRWAQFRLLKLRTFTGNTWQVIDMGRDWLSRNSDDPYSTKLRCSLAELTANTRGPEFQPTLQDMRQAFQDVFENSNEKDPDVIWTHCLFARKLREYSFHHDQDSEALKNESVVHLNTAIASANAFLAEPNPEFESFVERARWLVEHEKTVPEMQNLISSWTVYRDRILHPELDEALMAEVRAQQQFFAQQRAQELLETEADRAAEEVIEELLSGN